MSRLYFDSASTTPLLAEVREAMLPWLEGGWGNPSSLHADGRRAKEGIDVAREICSQAFGCLFGEFHFCSGGTESCNWAVIGGALAAPDHRREVLMSAAEHHAVLHTEPMLERLGFQVRRMRTNCEAQADLNHLSELVGDKTALVSLMHANNETGRINPVLEASRIVREQGALLHVDAVQTFPHVKADQLEADLVSVSAHKFGGPKGAGGLWIRGGVKPSPLIVGGGQEREMRAGTENTLAIVGMGEAVRQQGLHPEWQDQKRAARDAFMGALDDSLPFRITCPSLRLQPEGLLPGHLHLLVPGLAERLLIRLDQAGVSASSGSACSSGSLEPSHVMTACGFAGKEAAGGVRFSFGHEITPQMARQGADIFCQAIRDILAARAARVSPGTLPS